MAPGTPPRRWPRDVGMIAVVSALVVAVGLLPPDTSLQHVMSSGTLRVCVPAEYPPLVTGEPAAPGIDLEILAHVASDLGVRLQVVRNPAIGRSFNPRDWRITRAQCLVVAGGVIDTVTTRGFLSITAPHTSTGWAAATRDAPIASLEGTHVAFFPGASGLDRIALGAWLRSRGANVTVVSGAREASDGLRDGAYDVVVTEALRARTIATDVGGHAFWLPYSEWRAPIGFGLWKGDLTLERAMERSLRRLRDSGEIRRILERYELAPISVECRFCV